MRLDAQRSGQEKRPADDSARLRSSVCSPLIRRNDLSEPRLRGGDGLSESLRVDSCLRPDARDDESVVNTPVEDACSALTGARSELAKTHCSSYRAAVWTPEGEADDTQLLQHVVDSDPLARLKRGALGLGLWVEQNAQLSHYYIRVMLLHDHGSCPKSASGADAW